MMLIGVTVTVNIVTSVGVKGGRVCWCYILGYTVTTETGISTSEGGETEGAESSHCYSGHWHLYE